MLPGVLFDANTYRQLKPERFDALLELERTREVTRYAEPFVLTELVAHLADPQDRDFGPCRAAVVRVFRRCAGEGPCGMIRDSESRLHECITGKVLAKHDAHTEQMLILLERVARTPSDQPLTEDDNIRLRQLAAHVTAEEDRFADGTLRRLRETAGAAFDNETPEEKRRVRKVLGAPDAAVRLRRNIAERILRFHCGEAGLPLPEPLPDALISRVLKAVAAVIEFEARYLEKVSLEPVNVRKAKVRNLVWDQRLAFNIGQTIGKRTLWLVTDDHAFADVAEATGYSDRVHTLEAYEQWLRAS
jgi:hypothetical protein